MTARAWFLRGLLALGLLVARPSLAQAQEDPGATGPYAVTVTSYGSNSTSISQAILTRRKVVMPLALISFCVNMSLSL